jgi:putative FmdB family regulatory protein
MPVYEYTCSNCGQKFEMQRPISEWADSGVCPECGGEGTKLVSSCNFNLPGDGWPSKNNRVKGQMAAKNRRLDRKSKDLPKVSLTPNVDGESTDSWSDARKLAKSKGKVAETYTPYVDKEAHSKKR